MAVIPLTLTISLCLVATFVLFFLRESAHRAFSSAEHDSLLPLADETATSAPRAAGQTATHGGCGCPTAGKRDGGRTPCDACRRAQSRRAGAVEAAPTGMRS